MTVVLLAVGGLLALWGFYVLASLDAIAAVDVGSHLIIGGAVVAALAGITRALDRMRRQIEASAPRTEPLAPHLSSAHPAGSAPSVSPDVPPVAATSRPPERLAEPSVPRPAARTAPVQAEGPVPDFLVRTATSATVAAAAVTAPALLREGSLNGVNYRFYSDGSVESEGQNGAEHYPSLDALREAILARRSEASGGGALTSAVADQRKDLAEEIGSGAPEPFIDDHFGRDDVDAVADEPLESDLPVVEAPRAYGIRDDGDIEPTVGEVDGGLQDADVRFQASEDDLAPPLDAQFEETFEEDGLFYGREGDLGYDEPAVDAGEPVEERRERWSETLRMLLRRDRGNAGGSGDVDQKPEPLDDPFDFGDRRR